MRLTRRLFQIIAALLIALCLGAACASASKPLAPVVVVTTTPSSGAASSVAPLLPIASSPTVTLDPIASATPASDRPARLLIPSLGVDEAIIPIPIREGDWDLSQLDKNIGLLATTGTHPDDSLAMALVGHVNLSAIQRGPFANLWKTRLEDTIIYRAAGTDYVYAIKDKANVQPDEVKRLYVRDSQRLILLTCTDWDYVARTYPQRLIVQAQLVRQTPSP